MTGPSRKIVYGTPTDKCAITVRLSIENGLFAEEGLDMSVRVVFDGARKSGCIDSGELEIGEMGSPPAINAIAAGSRFKIVAVVFGSKHHMFLLCAKGIKNYGDLKASHRHAWHWQLPRLDYAEY